MKHVIIGNSAGAIGAVCGIRSCSETDEITIIASEKYHTYSRPLISYLLLGKTDEQRMKYRSDDFYEKNNVKTMLGTVVTKIDVDAMEVVLDNEERVAYDKLLVATGSTPFIPPMKGLDLVKNKFTFMKLDDAKELSRAINKDSRVLIVGAGLIGLKCAEAISGSVDNIKVIDLAPRILSSILDEEGAEIVREHIEKQGIEFVLGDSVEQFAENSAQTKGGMQIPFDILVLAVGVRPNTELISEAGGKVSRGVCINNKMETTIKNIYSAGDCTESFDISGDNTKILALLPNAYMQGECAGINMAGGVSTFDKAIPMNAIGFMGLHMITAGSYVGDTYIDTCQGYKKLFYKDDVLKGYIMIGNIEKAGIYTSLIREKTPLSSLDFELICKHPGLMAFSREARDKILAGNKNG